MKLSALQRGTLIEVLKTSLKNEWFRSRTSGERVTLASLHRQHLVKRRVWRGEGTASAAHEYQMEDNVREILLEVLRERAP